MIEIVCIYCGGKRHEVLGPGHLLRDDAPSLSRTEIGDNDTLYRCLNGQCGGVFGASKIRLFSVQEGKMGIGKAQVSV